MNLKWLMPIAAILAFSACGNHSFNDGYYDDEEETYISSSSSSEVIPPNPPSSNSNEISSNSSSSSGGVSPPNPPNTDTPSSSSIIAVVSSSSVDDIISSSSSAVSKCGGIEYDPSVQYCSIDGLKNYSGTLTDTRDGKTYKTMQIGSQIWMAENLNYKHGEHICYQNNKSNCDTYGRLYDWRTAMQYPTASTDRTDGSNSIPSGIRGICPEGWHIPSDAEWAVLVAHVGDNAGTKLKSASGWNGTDEYGFSALPAGEASAEGSDPSVDGTGYSVGGFYGLGTTSYWWTSYDLGYYLAYYRCIDCYGFRDGNMHKFYSQKTDYMSVRCVKDD